MNIQKIISDFLSVDSLDTKAVDKVSKAFMDYMDVASDSEKALLQDVITEKVKIMTMQARTLIQESKKTPDAQRDKSY